MKDKLQVEYISIDEIKPYKGNAKKHPQRQVDQIAESIQEFGFDDPIAICRGVIVEGHGRYLAARQLGIETVPVIRLDGLTEGQRKAYTLIHNQLTLNSGYDMDMLNAELMDLTDIPGIDMTDFGFDEPKEADEDEPDERDPSCQHNALENQDRMRFEGVGYYGMPEIRATQTVGDKLLRFMDWKEADDPQDYIVHFYYDDYKFLSAWREPDKYIERLRKFKAVISPDFSVYTDFPRALQIYACYRRQWVGAYWQYMGLDVIPDVVWGDKESYNYCFDGIPKRSTVAVSSVGVKRDKGWNGSDDEMFRDGYIEMMNRLEPTTVLYYGDMIDGLEGNIIQIPSYYAQKREYLNERQRAKWAEERAKQEE